MSDFPKISTTLVSKKQLCVTQESCGGMSEAANASHRCQWNVFDLISCFWRETLLTINSAAIANGAKVIQREFSSLAIAHEFTTACDGSPH